MKTDYIFWIHGRGYSKRKVQTKLYVSPLSIKYFVTEKTTWEWLHFQIRPTIASTLRQAVLLILDEIKYFFWSIPAISTMIAMAIIKDFKPSFTKFKCIVFNQYFNAQIFLQSTGSVESFMIIPTVPSGILWKSLIRRPCSAHVTMINVTPHMDYTSKQPKQHWFLWLLLWCYLACSDHIMGFI